MCHIVPGFKSRAKIVNIAKRTGRKPAFASTPKVSSFDRVPNVHFGLSPFLLIQRF
jgi:hypothetical protein